MLRLSYCIPGKTKIREDLLIYLYRAAYLSHQALITSLTDLTIALDGCTDVGSTFIYAFMATKGPEEFLLSIVDMTEERHTSDNIRKELIRTLSNYQLLKPLGAPIRPIHTPIIACVTDNPNTMIKLKRDITQEYPFIIGVKCFLDWLNLLVKDISSYEAILNTIKRNC